MIKYILPVSTMLALGIFLLISFKVVPESWGYTTVLALITALTVNNLLRSQQVDDYFGKIRDSIDENTDLLRQDLAIPKVGLADVRILDPHQALKVWNEFEDVIRVFNAPWALATTRLYPIFRKFISSGGKFEVLIFFSDAEEHKRDFNRRLRRLMEFTQKLKKDGVYREDCIEIRKTVVGPSPGTMFFLSSRNGQESSLLYIYPFVRNGRPTFTLEVNKKECLRDLIIEFDGHWEYAEVIAMDK